MPAPSLQNIALPHIHAIVTDIFAHPPDKKILLIHDKQAPLTRLLAEAYGHALPQAISINFDDVAPTTILKAFEALSPGDLVVLIQSSSFRLDAFRIRVHLFEKGLKVIEHPHLSHIPQEEWPTYIAALAYDRPYYHQVGPALKNRLDRSHEVRVLSESGVLVYEGPLEPAKLNIGDYRGMKNIGSQFPIGEVFTELKDLTGLNGQVALFAFGNQDFSIFNCSKPILMEVKGGKVMGTMQAPPEFTAILDEIRNHEGDIWIRELGFGLNRAMTREKQISYVGVYERMCGIHLSLGGKHALYPKEGFHKKKVKYHMDVFVAADQVLIDGETVFENGVYIVK